MGAGVFRSQHRSVWSSLPAANHPPADGTVVQIALPAWPVNVHRFIPPDISHRTGCPCSYTARHSVPEGRHERVLTGLPFPGRTIGRAVSPGRTTETVPSACPQVTTGPVGAGARQVTGEQWSAREYRCPPVGGPEHVQDAPGIADKEGAAVGGEGKDRSLNPGFLRPEKIPVLGGCSSGPSRHQRHTRGRYCRKGLQGSGQIPARQKTLQRDRRMRCARP